MVDHTKSTYKMWGIYAVTIFTPIINIYGLGVGISTVKKFWAGRGWGLTPGFWTTWNLIRLVTPIINIYGLGVGISTVKKFWEGRGGDWPPGYELQCI
jgi:hypothetical protein